MNTETGKIYRDPAEIAAAIARGEPLVQVSDRVAEMMDAGEAALLCGRRNRRKVIRDEHREEKPSHDRAKFKPRQRQSR